MKRLKKMMPLAAIALVLFAVIAVTVNTKAEENDTIADGVYIGSVYVGGMTEEEASDALSEYVESVQDAQITLAADDRTVVANASDFGISFEDTSVVQEAMDVCKSGSLIKRYKDTKDLEYGEKVISFPISIDETAVSELLEANVSELNIEAVDNGLVRENGEFRFIEGNAGVEVNVTESIAVIEDYLSSEWDGSDARIDLVAEIAEPKGSKEELAKVKDVLGTFTTNFSTSSAARCTNISVAAGKINGTVLYPGDEFSVGQTINPLDAANGYELAGAYENGQTVQAYGGGVCQVSTTLYNAAILAELEITQRSNHSMIVSYVEPSMDAAIAGDYKDLKIKNNRETPIYIEAIISGKNISFNIYGEEDRAANRVVKYESEVVSMDDPATQFVGTADPIGYVATVQSKHIGYVARLWKVVLVDGVEQSREQFNSSTYKSSPKIVNVGTASADPAATAAINAALATGDEATIYATLASYSVNASTVVDTSQTNSDNEVSREEASITGTVDTSQITGGSSSTDTSNGNSSSTNTDTSTGSSNSTNTGTQTGSGSTGTGTGSDTTNGSSTGTDASTGSSTDTTNSNE